MYKYVDCESYPNQKRVVIFRDNVKDVKNSGRPFLVAYQDNLLDAMNALTPAAFKLYVCLLFNADGFILRFSPENIHKMTGICKDTVRKAMTQLEEKGYLEYVDNGKYNFKENPNIKTNTNNW